MAMPAALDVDRHPEAAASFDRHPHPEEPAKRASRRMRVTAQDEGGPRRMRPGRGRRHPISGLPEIGTIARRSATADLRWLASRAPQGDGKESVPIRPQPRASRHTPHAAVMPPSATMIWPVMKLAAGEARK